MVVGSIPTGPTSNRSRAAAARVAELAYAPDLGSGSPQGDWGFESPLSHHVYRIRTGIMEQGGEIDAGHWVDRRDKLTRNVRWDNSTRSLNMTLAKWTAR